MSAELRAAAQAVLEELDIIRKHRETTGVGFLVVHVDTHEDLRRALASTSIDGVSGTGLEAAVRYGYQRGEADERYGRGHREDLSVRNYLDELGVRAALAKDGQETSGG